MANNIKGITVEIGGDTGPLNKALKDSDKVISNTQSELKEVNRQLKFDPTNTELLTQKQKLLATEISGTKDRLNILKEAQRQAQEQLEKGDLGEEKYRALQREVIKTESQLKNLEGQAIKSNAVLSKDEAIGNLKNMAKAAAGAAVATGAAFVGIGVAAVNNADELQRQSDVTGISAERLQELEYAGKNLGVELDTITGAQAKLTKSMFAAKGGAGTQAEAFKALGISVVDSNGQLKDAKDVMSEAFTALNGVGNETERDALSMQIFGKSAMEMNPLIKAGGDELNRLSDEARNNGAVMSNEAVSGLDTFGDTIDNLKSSVLGSVGTMLAGIMPKIQGILDGLMKLPQWVQENSTLLEIIGVVIGTVTALIIAFNVQQALLASGMTLWTAIAGVGTSITTALGVAFTFLTSPIGLVILAIGLVVGAFVLLWNKCEWFRNFWIGLWNNIKATVSSVVNVLVIFFTVTIPQAWDGLVAFFTGIPAWWDSLWAQVGQFFADCWNGIILFFTETIPAWIQSVIDWFNQLPYMVGLAIGEILAGIVNFGVSAWNWTTVELPKIIQGIVDWFAQLPGKVWAFLVAIVTSIGTWGTNMVQKATIEIPKFISSVISFFQQLPGKIWVFFADVVSKVVTWAANLVTTAGTEIPKFVSSVMSFIGELPGKMLEIGENIVKGIWDGINGAVDWLHDRISDFCGGIVEGFKKKLKIHSPSVLFADIIGKNLALGIGQGFTENMKDVVATMTAAIPTTWDTGVEVRTAMAAAYGGYSAAASNYSNASASVATQSSGGIGTPVINQYFQGKVPTPSEYNRQARRSWQEAILKAKRG